jgi:hypothetical protein
MLPASSSLCVLGIEERAMMSNEAVDAGTELVQPHYRRVAAYDNDTGEYLGPVHAYRCPRSGSYPLPANAIEGMPPSEARPLEAWRANAERDGWELVADYRAVALYEKASGIRVPALGFAQVPGDDLTALEPPTPEVNTMLRWAGEAWELAPDFSAVPIYSTLSGMSVPSPVPGDSLPPDVTLAPPPECGSNEAVQWSEEEARWQVVPDHRGDVYWLEDGSQHVIAAIGEVAPEEAMAEPPQATDADLAMP